MVKIICWARTASDTRDTASSTLSFEFCSASVSPAKVAKALDEWGNSAAADYVRLGVLVPAAANKPEHRVASGHGVTVVYDTGKTRTFRSN